ncbi:SigB/SigF/SigG family RNA polymerase sigma factor [Nocardia sp. CDC159]|uniref:SigB/SigF/SigG family RNA polymerase sigma factor n=1 Tax=Nocardia pulmonis TaxID=2951408 RepID=A0A9X2EHR3_9NOCA|nr:MULTISPECIES: SigB/SigF/SigG family RNA polymerase sigma factor [Nocardia]MCM6778291.1 SigB/SigF/SigG family RNA polymerase sigma factor [Nocardia pulmonis]MCM6791180.1 SigB/SigF/SigG family RNA polymerase sigma factor [Nocardia sp. CDC159]
MEAYECLEPWFEKRAGLAAADPERDAVRSRIIEIGLPLADHIAQRYSGRGEQVEDLRQVARVGLVLAVDRFEVGRGTSFLSFAVPTIMGEVRRHFRDQVWAVRVPRPVKDAQTRLGAATERLLQRLGRTPTPRELAGELDLDVDTTVLALMANNAFRTDSIDQLRLDDDPPTSLGAGIGQEERCYRLVERSSVARPLIAALSAEERELLHWRYFESLTQTQIAERLGVSQMHVSRLLSRIIDRLHDQAVVAA